MSLIEHIVVGAYQALFVVGLLSAVVFLGVLAFHILFIRGKQRLDKDIAV